MKSCKSNSDCDLIQYCDSGVGVCDSCGWLCKSERNMQSSCQRNCRGYLERISPTKSTTSLMLTTYGILPTVSYNSGGTPVMLIMVLGLVSILIILIMIAAMTIFLLNKRKKKYKRKVLRNPTGLGIDQSLSQAENLIQPAVTSDREIIQTVSSKLPNGLNCNQKHQQHLHNYTQKSLIVHKGSNVDTKVKPSTSKRKSKNREISSDSNCDKKQREYDRFTIPVEETSFGDHTSECTIQTSYKYVSGYIFTTNSDIVRVNASHSTLLPSDYRDSSNINRSNISILNLKDIPTNRQRDSNQESSYMYRSSNRIPLKTLEKQSAACQTNCDTNTAIVNKKAESDEGFCTESTADMTRVKQVVYTDGAVMPGQRVDNAELSLSVNNRDVNIGGDRDVRESTPVPEISAVESTHSSHPPSQSYVRNRHVFGVLKRLPYVDGYYSEGRYITVYVDLKTLQKNWVITELMKETDQPAELFNVQHSSELE